MNVLAILCAVAAALFLVVDSGPVRAGADAARNFEIFGEIIGRATACELNTDKLVEKLVSRLRGHPDPSLEVLMNLEKILFAGMDPYVEQKNGNGPSCDEVQKLIEHPPFDD